MKKTGLILAVASAGVMGMGAYVLLNKKTKKKADDVINNLLNKADTLTKNM